MRNFKLLLIFFVLLIFAGCSRNNELNFNIDPRVEFDPYHNLITIDSPHAETHEGEHWFFTNQTTLGLGATRTYLLKPTCPNDTHLIVDMRSTAEANYFLYESPTITNNGTTRNTFNRNRNYQDTNELKIYLTPTVTSNGLAIDQKHFGNGQNIGGEFRSLNEIILNCSKNYLVIITSESASNDISFVFDWYE